MGKPVRTKLEMWTSWGYCMTPQIFSSRSEALQYAREMRDNGYIFGFRASPAYLQTIK